MSPKEILGVNVEGPKMVSKWTREQFAQAMQQLSDITSPASLADKLAACDGTGSMREIILVQLALTKCGYQPGTVDGLRARADGTASVTTQAVKKFQQDHGLKDDGVAGPVTMAELARTLLGGVATAASETAPRTVAGAEPIAPVPLTAPSVPAVTSEELPPIVVASEGGGVPDTARETVLKVPSWLKKDIPRQTAGGNGMLDPGPETALKVPSVPIKGDSLQVAQSTDTSVEHANPEEDYRQGEALIGWEGNINQALRGMALLERAARAGHVKAQNLAGLHYASGVRVPADYPKALSYLRPAAERGDKDAQNNLAHLLYFGLGMRQDLRGALAWAEKASAKGVGASDKLLVEIKGEMRDPSIPASSPESTKTMDAQRLDEVAADLRARRDAGKKYGLPFPEDRKPVLDAIAQLVKLGDNVRAAELIAMSREIVARAGIEEDKIYGDFKRSLARLEASANGGSWKVTKAR